ncbi:hypothetical protein BHM03_00011640 [Ensete ventricosum]|nr:hypothetical protein BHM03_00011640 [Ensete ventricosum]
MGWELVNREPPSLPPIRTSGIDANPHVEDPSESAGNEEVGCCVTPKSEETVLKPALVCPPAPRKPRPPKRRKVRSGRVPTVKLVWLLTMPSYFVTAPVVLAVSCAACLLPLGKVDLSPPPTSVRSAV